MAPRPVPRSERIDLPLEFVDLAQRRTEYLFGHLTYGDMPLRRALASAWLQGASDAAQALEHKHGPLLAPEGDAPCSGVNNG